MKKFKTTFTRYFGKYSPPLKQSIDVVFSYNGQIIEDEFHLINGVVSQAFQEQYPWAADEPHSDMGGGSTWMWDWTVDEVVLAKDVSNE